MPPVVFFLLVCDQVAKVGRSTGLTFGRMLAYAVEYYPEAGSPFVLDFLIESETQVRLPSDWPSASSLEQITYW